MATSFTSLPSPDVGVNTGLLAIFLELWNLHIGRNVSLNHYLSLSPFLFHLVLPIMARGYAESDVLKIV